MISKVFKIIIYFQLPHHMKNIGVSSFLHDVDHNKVCLLCESILSLLRALYRRSNGNSLDATVYPVQPLKRKHKYRLHLCCRYTEKSKGFGLSLEHIIQCLQQHYSQYDAILWRSMKNVTLKNNKRWFYRVVITVFNCTCHCCF